MKKIIVFILFVVVTTFAISQNIVKKCKDCGKPIASCKYNGKHPKVVPEDKETDNSTVMHSSVNSSPKRIDLGLPSGTIWADRNIGANSPEGYGNYYAWGETSPKSDYSWATYFDALDNNGNAFKTYFLYDKNFNKGEITIVGTNRDAAKKNWSDSWRMPTGPQIKELFDKCIWKWTRQKGINGYLLTGPNGNSIFLPAAGFMHRRTLNEKGESCNYWCGDLYETKKRYEQMLEFEKDPKYWSSTQYATSIFGDKDFQRKSEIYRRRGHSIRPVAK